MDHKSSHALRTVTSFARVSFGFTLICGPAYPVEWQGAAVAATPYADLEKSLWRRLLSGNQLYSPVLRTAFFGAVGSDKVCLAIAVRH